MSYDPNYFPNGGSGSVNVSSTGRPVPPGVYPPLPAQAYAHSGSSGVGKIILIIILFLMLVFSALFNFLFLVILVAESGSNQKPNHVKETYYSGESVCEDKIAIIHIDGVIEEGEDYKDFIDKAANDDSVKAVVLRVNSPGGTVTGSDYILHRLETLRKKKPIIVSMGALAASGGYYVSMGVGDLENSIYAEPSTWTGSIGVIISRYDASQLFMTKLGVKNDAIKSGEMKGMGSMLEPLTEDQRKILQDLVDDSFIRFKEIIQGGRVRFEENPAELDKLATGQVYSSNQALELGLIDKIGFLDDAIERAKQVAGLESALVVEYGEIETLSDILFAAQSGSTPADMMADMKKILSLSATPKAYYLWTL